jgi:pyruvate/2-oxoglutarate dehydrogenase complex dihydrolipoamide acyltransferase (E2) component
MPTIIRMPVLGIAIASMTITRWFLREGESVTRGQPLLEVQTDKITMEVPSEASGVLRKILLPEGAKMMDGTPIAIIGEAGEDVARLAAEAGAEAQAAHGGPLASEDGAASPGEVAAAAAASSQKSTASPLAKRIAKERGVDLSRVTPSSPGGRITEKDVLRYLEQSQAAAGGTPEASGAQAAPAQPSPAPGDDYEVIPLEGPRKVIAENVLRSARSAPHYTLGIEIDCGRLVALREALKAAHGTDLTYVPFVVKAMAKAVEHVPIANATIRDDRILVYKTAHVGVAVASGDLIFVPVVRNAAARTIVDIAREVEEQARLARNGTLAPAQVAGGTLTLTNMGVTEVDVRPGIAVLHQSQAVIVVMGRVKDRAVVVEGAVAARPIMDLTFTYDHRIVMGVPGGRYAERVKHYLESPELLTAS